MGVSPEKKLLKRKNVIKKGDSVKGNSKIESLSPFMRENLIRAKVNLDKQTSVSEKKTCYFTTFSSSSLIISRVSA